DAEILDMRKKDVTVQGQEVLTADRAALKISLLLSYEIADPVKAAHNAQNYAESLDAAAQLAVKAAAADSTLADILDDRPEFEKAVRARVKTESDRMGIRPLSVEVRDIGFPQELNQMLGELAKNPRPAKKRPVRASR
ncbi:hypothetical protein HY256_00600, partial [Candidatus Sumerlaeota bacterium]|nr:hypothetical protein [Candidatus Sumerlaeota bacterium]